MPTYNGVDYTIDAPESFAGHWLIYSSELEYVTAMLRPCPFWMTADRDVCAAYRCRHCLTEFPVDIERYVNNHYNYTPELAEALNCHPRCRVCSEVGHEPHERHTYCSDCDSWDCGLSESEHVWCDTCDQYNCGRNHVIRNYSFKPRPQFLGNYSAPYFLGFELEVSSDDEQRDGARILDWTNANIGNGSVYLKEDGSVNGFEIVSHPMTSEFFESIDWRGFFSVVRQNDSDRTYEPSGHGLHVHVSRSAFPNTLTLARWVYLWNARHNRETAISLCRRESSSWAAFKPSDVKQLANVAKSERDWVRHPFYPRFERYSLINLTNSDTVEFRGFRSTRRSDHFKRSIRSIYRSVDYVRSMQPWHATPNATDYSLSAAVADN